MFHNGKVSNLHANLGVILYYFFIMIDVHSLYTNLGDYLNCLS